MAEGLPADPADARTLARMLEAETGMGFGRRRTQARPRAALGHLAEGPPAAVVAHRVGYVTPSSFAVVFRRAFGVSPARSFNST